VEFQQKLSKMLNFKKHQRQVFFTNDVETTSLQNHCLSDATGKLVQDVGIPALLGLYKKYNVKATFFITGYIAEQYPDLVRNIFESGHEVGCHGYSHDSSLAFDILNYYQQIEHLTKAKSILESITGVEVISFRAPALRVNKYTPLALKEAGFKIDSSVAPQRADMFLSFGSLKKLKWLTAPRHCYFTKLDDLSKKGNSGIFEIPVLAYIFPYIGTFMRISPTLTKIIRRFADLESRFMKHYPVLLIHPNEFIEEEVDLSKFRRRSKNIISYYIGDKLRHKLKLKNLGSSAIPLLEEQLIYFKSKGYNFLTLKEHYENYMRRNL